MIVKETRLRVDWIILTSDDLFAFATSRLGCLQEFSVLETYAKPEQRLPGEGG